MSAGELVTITVDGVEVSVPKGTGLVEAALARQKQAKDTKSQENQSVRVDADKLDRLINLVGELIIATAGANLIAKRTRNAEQQHHRQ